MFDFRRRPAWFTGQALLDVKAHVLAEYPNEACGFVLVGGKYLPVKNEHPEPKNNFCMSSNAFARRDILGVVHSHIGNKPYPSEADMVAQLQTAVPWGIVCTEGESVTDPVWFGDQLPIAPLEQRPFVPGIYDCYSLIRDWHRVHRNITLIEGPRDWNWWEPGRDGGKQYALERPKQDLYADNFERAGFVKIGTNVPIEEGDVFLMKFRSDVLNHGGVYLGGGLMLHHLTGQISQKANVHIWNHKSIDFWIRYKGTD